MDDRYLTDPTIKTVSILRHGKFCKIPNKNFRGITMDVMDIYPVIRYSEIKFAERLGVIKEVENCEKKHVYELVSPPRGVQEAVDKMVSGEGNDPNRVNGADKIKGSASVLPSPVKEESNNTKKEESNNTNACCEIVVNHGNEKRDDISVHQQLPPLQKKPLRKKHSYEPIDPEDFDSISRRNSKRNNGKRKSSVYEILDLALHNASRQSSVKSRSSRKSRLNESTVVEALDLDSCQNFQTRSMVTVSCKSSEENGLNGDISIAQQRSVQVVDELTRSLDSGEMIKSKVKVINPKREETISVSSRGTSNSGSHKSSMHLSFRSSHSSQLSRKRYR